eukprot:987423-Alexandrium_andersonii.AAC.1
MPGEGCAMACSSRRCRRPHPRRCGRCPRPLSARPWRGGSTSRPPSARPWRTATGSSSWART